MVRLSLFESLENLSTCSCKEARDGDGFRLYFTENTVIYKGKLNLIDFVLVNGNEKIRCIQLYELYVQPVCSEAVA